MGRDDCPLPCPLPAIILVRSHAMCLLTSHWVTGRCVMARRQPSAGCLSGAPRGSWRQAQKEMSGEGGVKIINALKAKENIHFSECGPSVLKCSERQENVDWKKIESGNALVKAFWVAKHIQVNVCNQDHEIKISGIIWEAISYRKKSKWSSNLEEVGLWNNYNQSHTHRVSDCCLSLGTDQYGRLTQKHNKL